jgi:hypothetical protein
MILHWTREQVTRGGQRIAPCVLRSLSLLRVSWDEIRALAERHRWSPPGAKSPLKLLREDRDS